MSEPKKNPGVAFWATVVVVCLPLFYVLSFGPACWYIARSDIRRPHKWGFERPQPWFDAVYWPIGWCVGQEPRYIRPAVGWYVMVGAPEGSEMFLPSNREGFESNAREGVGWRK